MFLIHYLYTRQRLFSVVIPINASACPLLPENFFFCFFGKKGSITKKKCIFAN